MTELEQAYATIEQGWQQVEACWEQTVKVWRDTSRERFEREHWRPLASAVRRALTALEELDFLIEQAYRDLED